MRGYLAAKACRERRQREPNANKCPRCGDQLDTGWECTACGFDAMPSRPSGARPDQADKET